MVNFTAHNKVLYRAESLLYMPLKKLRHDLSVQREFRDALPREFEVIWIDPRDISAHMLPDAWKALRRKTGRRGGALVDGDWDIKQVDYMKFTEDEPFLSCYQHWVEGQDWSETFIYQYYVKNLSSGEPCRFSSVRALRKRYEKLDSIFDEILKNGCMSSEKQDLVKVSVARDASLIWGPDGRHRICMAICAGLENIPARLGFVHCDAVSSLKRLRSPKHPSKE